MGVTNVAPVAGIRSGCRDTRRGLNQGGIVMLVLSRKLGERIIVPHCDMSITVVAIEGNTVRLGITAPSQVGIYREELWQRVHAEKEQPAGCRG
jgi:carbon storage regulator